MLSLSRMSIRSGTGSAINRTRAITRHMATPSSSAISDEAPILFEENLSSRRFILNRPKKLNALDIRMINLISSKIEAWDSSSLTGVIVGTSVGKGFCSGGDVAGIVEHLAQEGGKEQAIEYFTREFGLDYTLATLSKPYIAVMDGITFGGGVGLAAPARFRVATEKTSFSMPETRIGYFPDVGASYYLSRLDGEIGTYLALTGNSLTGRATYEHGFATHFISSHRVPILLERIAALEEPSLTQIDQAIEELSYEREPTDDPAPLVGAVRVALDDAFGKGTVEEIFETLQNYAQGSDNADVIRWAKDTLATMEERSPTSLKVSLLAIRKGKHMSLLEALNMELGIATAFCSGATPDFVTGVRRVLIEKDRSSARTKWFPADLSGVSVSTVESEFFQPASAKLHLPERLQKKHEVPSHFLRYTLPSEEEIGQAVMGSHKASGGSALELTDLVAKFENLRKGKHGVADKVKEVVQRKCTLFEDNGCSYLRWKH